MKKLCLIFILFFACSNSEEPGNKIFILTVDVGISNGVIVSLDNGQSLEVDAWSMDSMSVEEGVYNYSIERRSFLANDIILSGSVNMNSNKKMTIVINTSGVYIIDWSGSG